LSEIVLNLPIEKITLRQPDDWHLHLRDGKVMEAVLAHTAHVFRRAIIMPNLNPPILSIDSARNYRERIKSAIPDGLKFEPLMTSYLTDSLSSDVLAIGKKEGVFTAAKLYPANVTTNSEKGVSNLDSINYLFETMEEVGLPLLVHGEVTDTTVDIFDREEVFIERCLEPILKRFPALKVVLEHITTEQAVQFVEASSSNLAATITPHHLHLNRNAMFSGGFRSDFYCLPVVKRERHRLALRRAATSGKESFFLGTDSAPHLRASKENSCACAGIFNARNAIESYTEVFDQENSLDCLEAFASLNGPKFYQMPVNSSTITLIRKPQLVPEKITIKTGQNRFESIVPFHAGETLGWSAL
tara:strand:+ start:25 stop:1098 length:1074 start_codon:yes stop_codon:yes gene_type:complete